MKEPSWLKEVQPYSSLDYKDLIEMFGFRNKSHFEDVIGKGLFPPHDTKCIHGGGGKKRLWYVKTIRKEIKRINAEEANGKEVLSVMPVNETNREDEADTDKKV